MMGNAEDAQDVYQETFLKAYRYLPQVSFRIELEHLALPDRHKCVPGSPSPKAEASGIKFRRDLCWRGFAVSRIDGRGVQYDRAPPEPRTDSLRQEIGQQIDAAVSTLSETERLVFEMKHYGGLKLKNIGRILETTEGAAKNYLFRATRKLRAQLSHT